MPRVLREGFRRRRWPSAYLMLMIVLAEAVYVRPRVLTGKQALVGADYLQLHIARLAFAQENLFGPRHTLPAWSPRELLGAPFAANLQSFPWIPTRLVLLLFSPEAAYAPAVALAVLLSAIFTYLYCRRAGLSEIASAASGWTFACAGYFSSRVALGHLPLLEGYPALPLLLWLSDRALDPDRHANSTRDVIWLSLSTACVALAGHPQIPAYAITAALVYVVWRGRGWLRVRLLAAIGVGISLTFWAWWPMLLFIRRSTRSLPLDPPVNDISFPYRRILALFSPGIDGWPAWLHPSDGRYFSGYPDLSYFYDTVSYVGLAPIVASAALLVLLAIRRRLPEGRFLFLASLGIAAFVCSLPFMRLFGSPLPGLIFRSPARLFYLTTFALAIALGVCVDGVRSWKPGRTWVAAIVAAGLALHGFDLGRLANRFVWTIEIADLHDAESVLHRIVPGDGRMAVDYQLWSSRRQYDDVGGFDSLFLARPYRALFALSGLPPGYNTQTVNGASLALAALQAGAVATMLTPAARSDLSPIGMQAGMNVYRIPDPSPRAVFFPKGRVQYLKEETILQSLRSGYTRETLLLPGEGGGPPVEGRGSAEDLLTYSRPSSDDIRVEISASGPGFVNVIESYDPGWQAQMDGRSVRVLAGNGFTLATPVPGGKHSLTLHYSTPGRKTGWTLSFLGAGLLSLLAAASKRFASGA